MIKYICDYCGKDCGPNVYTLAVDTREVYVTNMQLEEWLEKTFCSIRHLGLYFAKKEPGPRPDISALSSN